jgi:hypothetical protein
MLQESYLLSLHRLKKDRFVVGDTSPKLCRWLWIQWAAKILGWRGRHPKVQADAFGAEIHEALHVKIYPLPKVKRDVDRVPVPPPEPNFHAQRMLPE